MSTVAGEGSLAMSFGADGDGDWGVITLLRLLRGMMGDAATVVVAAVVRPWWRPWLRPYT